MGPDRSLTSTSTVHMVQLFDSDDSLADAVSAFLYEGYRRRETLLVVIDHQDFRMPVAAWNHPTIEALKSRLSRHTEFSRDFHRILKAKFRLSDR